MLKAFVYFGFHLATMSCRVLNVTKYVVVTYHLFFLLQRHFIQADMKFLKQIQDLTAITAILIRSEQVFMI